jgi:hypothetical protein
MTRYVFSSSTSSTAVSRDSGSESYVTTDGQSASLSRYKEPIWVSRPDFYYRQTAVSFLMLGALSDERTSLSFTIAAVPCQCSRSRVPVPWYSRPYFTVSDVRLPFSSPPTTRRVTVEVLDPTSTRVSEETPSVLFVILPRGGLHRKHCFLTIP